MSLIQRFEDFEAFQVSREFVREVELTIRRERMYREKELRWQMERALISVLSNFAEGYERGGRDEFINFLSYSKGSAGEVRSQLIYAVDQSLISCASFEHLTTLGVRSCQLLGGLMAHLRTSDSRGPKFRPAS
jgi:four helix bundle protein